MGTRREDGGGDRPSDGGLPGLPPEWGTIIIPDDASALRSESEQIRRELRRNARRSRWRRWRRLVPLTRRTPDDLPALGLPLLIMSVAIIATLISLLAIAWPVRTAPSIAASGQFGIIPAAGGSAAAHVPQPGLTSLSGGPAAAIPPPVPLTMTLAALGGGPVRLRDLLPAVILLVDGCACADLIARTAAAVEPGVTVAAVARTAPSVPGQPVARRLTGLADTTGALRLRYGLPGHLGPVALLVRTDGDPVAVVPDVTSVDAFRRYLSRLT